VQGYKYGKSFHFYDLTVGVAAVKILLQETTTRKTRGFQLLSNAAGQQEETFDPGQNKAIKLSSL